MNMVSYFHVLREFNFHVDLLANEAFTFSWPFFSGTFSLFCSKIRSSSLLNSKGLGNDYRGLKFGSKIFFEISCSGSGADIFDELVDFCW